MTSKHLLRCVVIFATLNTSMVSKSVLAQDTIKSQSIRELLNVPFGTLVRMNVEIIDGNELNDKGHQGSYLFKIISVDSLKLSKLTIIDFKDETGKFPNDRFKLFKYLYKKETSTLSSNEIRDMNEKYVGQKFTVMAYESGEFIGIPNGYFKYQPVRQDYGFHFRHYIIIVAELDG